MIRKFVIAAAAIAALGTASLATTSTPASAHGWGGYHHFHGGYFHRGFGFYRLGYYDSCLRTRWVVNRFGELVPRRVNVCY
jgi:hypothetical protein